MAEPTSNTPKSIDPTPLAGSINRQADRHRVEVRRGLAELADFTASMARLPHSHYRVVLSNPFPGGLNPRPDGLFDAFAKGQDGKIQAVARLQKLGPSMLTGIGMVAGHAMLVEISHKLDAIQRDIDTIIAFIVEQPYAEIRAEIVKLKNFDVYNHTQQQQQLHLTISNLGKATQSAIQHARTIIMPLDPPKEWHLSRVIYDESDEIAEKIDLASKAVCAAILGVKTMAQAHYLLFENEPECADRTARKILDWLDALLDIPFEHAEWIARLLTTVKPEDRKELFWQKVHREIIAMRKQLEDTLAGDRPLTMLLEYSPEDIVKFGNKSGEGTNVVGMSEVARRTEGP